MALPNLGGLCLDDGETEANTDAWVQYNADDYFRTTVDVDDHGRERERPNANYVQAPDDADWTDGDRAERARDPVDLERLRDGQWVWRAVEGDNPSGLNYNPETYWASIRATRGTDPTTRGDVPEEAIRDLAQGEPTPDPAARRPLASTADLDQVLSARAERIRRRDLSAPQNAAFALRRRISNMFDDYTVDQMRTAFLHESVSRARRASVLVARGNVDQATVDESLTTLAAWLREALADVENRVQQVESLARASSAASRERAATEARRAAGLHDADEDPAPAPVPVLARAGAQRVDLPRFGGGAALFGVSSARLLDIADRPHIEDAWLPPYVRQFIRNTDRAVQAGGGVPYYWLRPLIRGDAEAANVFTVKWFIIRQPSVAFGMFTLSMRVRDDCLLGRALNYMVEMEGRQRREVGPLFVHNYLRALGEPLRPAGDAARFVNDVRYFVDNWRQLGSALTNTTMAANGRLIQIKVNRIPGSQDMRGDMHSGHEIRIVCHDQFVRWLVHVWRERLDARDGGAPRTSVGVSVARLVQMVSDRRNEGDAAGVPLAERHGAVGGGPTTEYWNRCYEVMHSILGSVVGDVHQYATANATEPFTAALFLTPFDANQETPARFGTNFPTDDELVFTRADLAERRASYVSFNTITAEARMWYGVDHRTRDAALGVPRV